MDVEELRRAGTSRRAISHHYDISDDFFRLWLGPEMVYSCGLWDDDDPGDNLDRAQLRKLDLFATRLGVAGAHVLDVGCGWGALLYRWRNHHRMASGVGLTLSAAQQELAMGRGVADVDYRLESWVDHEPVRPYDAISCIEMSEHLASDALSVDEKVQVYRAFFDRCAGWLRPGGRMGLQLICLDNVGHEASRPGRGPLSELLRTEIFPESMPGSLAELVLGWETHFQLDGLLEHADHYRRTFRAWSLAARAGQDRARMLVGDDTLKTFMRYFAAGELCFRRREHTLYRVILTKRPEPKRWVGPIVPSGLATPAPGAAGDERAEALAGASVAAVRAHYDVSNEFYRLWLGPTMMYSSGMGTGGRRSGAAPESLEQEIEEKLAFFAQHVLGSEPGRLLDVGCGWGWTLRWLIEKHHVASAVGLTLSEAQRDHIARDPVPGVTVRLEGWSEHQPAAPYDAIVSFGAFEHFARDGTTGAERVAIYRAFFARCYSWLVPDGRMGLETIIHDSAPDTAVPRGRGPLGDHVLALFPESLCPHLNEVVLGFEPYFEVEVLRSDGADFARTFRTWHLRLRSHEQQATALVGAETVARWRRYLASSEVQFRMRTLSNLRLVLHRRPAVRR